MISKYHYFYLLSNSPWPFLCSLSSFGMLLSMILFFKFNIFIILSLNVFTLILCSMFWWIYYSSEMNLMGKNSFNTENCVKTSMLLFISSEILFFFSFFWSYFNSSLSPYTEAGMLWPPVLIESFNCLNIPLVNTLVLLTSGVTVTMSHHFLMKGNDQNFKIYLMLTFLLGAFFSILQLMEYNSSFFSISDGSFGTTFFMLTGFHGIHVLIGSFFLLTVFVRSSFFTLCKSNSLSFELSSWYWHFVDVVWLFLYYIIYYLNS